MKLLSAKRNETKEEKQKRRSILLSIENRKL